LGDVELRGMPGYKFVAVIMITISLPGIAAAETWHGQIQCAAIPTLDTKQLIGVFEMSTDGTRLTYSRPVHKADSEEVSGVMELGHGTLTGNDIKLQGGAAATGYSFTATYQGQMEGDRVVLTGEQVWTAPTLHQPFHRDCRITLKRS
jgi:hypothetical protein